MLKATIYLDDVVFSGIDPDAEDLTNPSPAFRNGFHNYNHGGGRDVLAWGDEPKLVRSHIMLMSYLKQIIDRMRDGTLATGTLRIEIGDDRQ